MAFKEGKPKTGGRKKGVQNKINRTVKEVFSEVFNDLQQDKKNNLSAFAKKYPRDFYQLASKLIPTELQNSGEMQIAITRTIVRRAIEKPS